MATITDPKEKKNNSATCTANFTIKQPQPPVVSCSANPTTIAIGEPATITMTATDPQGWPMTYSWSATGGQLSGSGTSATLTATNADAGNTITVTGTATDARANLSGSCTASVNVPAVKKCTTIEDWGECTFEKNPKKPWRVDNDCKDTLDKLVSSVAADAQRQAGHRGLHQPGRVCQCADTGFAAFRERQVLPDHGRPEQG